MKILPVVLLMVCAQSGHTNPRHAQLCITELTSGESILGARSFSHVKGALHSQLAPQ